MAQNLQVLGDVLFAILTQFNSSSPVTAVHVTAVPLTSVPELNSTSQMEERDLQVPHLDPFNSYFGLGG